MTPQRFRQRPSRVIPSTITALVLAAVGGVALWAGITRLAHHAWAPVVSDTARTVSSWRWDSRAVLIGTVVVAVLGLALLLCVLVPGRRPGQALRPRVATNAQETLTDAGLARIVAAHAARVDGVESAHASARGRSIAVRVQTPLRDGAHVKAAVVSATSSTMAALPLAQKVTTKIDVRTPKEVA